VQLIAEVITHETNDRRTYIKTAISL